MGEIILYSTFFINRILILNFCVDFFGYFCLKEQKVTKLFHLIELELLRTKISFNLL